MFGPGSFCRCATCTELPLECTWGSGPYAGTILLYAECTRGSGPYAGTILLYAQVNTCTELPLEYTWGSTDHMLI